MRNKGKKKVFLRRLLRNLPDKPATGPHLLRFGDYGVVSRQSGYLTQNQREAVRKLMSRRLRPHGGKYWVYLDHYISLTKKPKGSRMGKGKGKFFADRAPVRAGRLLFEFNGLDELLARELFASISKKLPIPVTWVPRATGKVRSYE